MPKPVASKELRRKIREEFQKGLGTLRELAEKHGVSLRSVRNWYHREAWKQEVKQVEAAVKQRVVKELAADLKERVSDFTEKEYYQVFQGVARFDVAELYEEDAGGQLQLRKDWRAIATKHKALEMIQADILTMENGQVVTRLKVRPYDKLKAAEKLGRLLGYDKTDQPGAGTPITVPMVVMLTPLNPSETPKTVKTVEVKAEPAEKVAGVALPDLAHA